MLQVCVKLTRKMKHIRMIINVKDLKCSPAGMQNAAIIFEGSCDTEDWSNG